MADPSVDRYHCYECGEGTVTYASLYPLEGIPGFGGSSIVPGTDMKFNVDFNVCAPCYVSQFKHRYGGEAPRKVLMAMEIDAIHKKYLEA